MLSSFYENHVPAGNQFMVVVFIILDWIIICFDEYILYLTAMIPCRQVTKREHTIKKQ